MTQNSNDLPTAQSPVECARAGEVCRLTGLKRNTLYRLLKAGKIKGAVLPVTGKKSGVRVFDLNSIRQFIDNHMQKGTNANV